jgi:lipopolysaccharide transport system permease protein
LRFGIQLLLLLVLIGYYMITGKANFQPTWCLALFPFFVFLMAIQGLGFGMIISSITTKYRDLALLVTFAMPLIMYATPIVYPLSTLEGRLRLVISANPMTPVIEGIRLGFFGKGIFDVFSMVYLVIVSVAVLLIGVVVFNKVQKNFIDTV